MFNVNPCDNCSSMHCPTCCFRSIPEPIKPNNLGDKRLTELAERIVELQDDNYDLSAENIRLHGVIEKLFSLLTNDKVNKSA